jgi:hypothetical protein
VQALEGKKKEVKVPLGGFRGLFKEGYFSPSFFLLFNSYNIS